jgi:hypothetical protein
LFIDEFGELVFLSGSHIGPRTAEPRWARAHEAEDNLAVRDTAGVEIVDGIPEVGEVAAALGGVEAGGATVDGVVVGGVVVVRVSVVVGAFPIHHLHDDPEVLAAVLVDEFI